MLIAADLVRALRAGRRRACCRSPACSRSGIWWCSPCSTGSGRGLLRPGLRRARARDRGAPSHLVRGQLARAARAPGVRAPARAGGGRARGRGRRRRRRVPGRRGHVRAERGVHLAALRVRSLPAPRAERSARRELGEGARLRALAAVAVGDARRRPRWPAALPRPARGAAALRRAQRPRRRRVAATARSSRRPAPARCSTSLVVSQRGRAAALPDLRLRHVERRDAALRRLRVRHRASGSSWPSPSSSGRVRDRRHGRVGHARCRSRVPPELRGRVHSLDWFVSIGLTPISFALTGPVSKAIGIDATLRAGRRPAGGRVRRPLLRRRAAPRRGRYTRCSAEAYAGRAPRRRAAGRRRSRRPRPGRASRLLEQRAGQRLQARALALDEQRPCRCSASSTIRRTSSSTSCCVSLGGRRLARAAACRPARPSATAIGPMTSLIPQRPTMPRAIWVICWMSDSAPVVSLAVDDALGRAAAEGDLDLADQLVALVAVAVGLGRRERHAEGLAARDDRDLAHRVGALGEHADERVAGLVVGGALAVGVGS